MGKAIFSPLTESAFTKKTTIWKMKVRAVDNGLEIIYSILLPVFFFLLSAGEFLFPSRGGGRAAPLNYRCPSTFHLGRDILC